MARPVHPEAGLAASGVPSMSVRPVSSGAPEPSGPPLDRASWMVEPGDTLHGIARHLQREGASGNIAELVEALARLNCIADPDRIEVGQVLTLPPRLGRPRTDYWVHSTLHLPASVDDRHTQVIDRRNGTPMLCNLPEVQEVFARNHRVWYVVTPPGGNAGNTSEVSAFLRQHMDVVYEDYQAMVLVRDDRFRPAEVRQANERGLRAASVNPLP